VSDVKTARTTNTLDYKAFPGGHLTIAAAGSPGNLAALPIRYLLCDEIDKYPASSGSEGDPISLAFKRTATFWNRKVVLCCSPTIDGESRIAKAFGTSDQREFTVPCHACGSFQVLKWAQVKWDNGLATKEARAASAYYECEHCQAHWNDVERWRAVEIGRWLAAGPSFRGGAKIHSTRGSRDHPACMGRYIYRAWVTNLPLTPAGIWHFYDGRAGMEPRICELREDFALRKIPAASFAANALYLEIVRLAYNLVTAFQRHCLDESWQSLTLQKLRYRLFLIPGELTRPQNRPVLRLRPSPMIESLAETILARAARLKPLQP
jgi:hypothetical protein